MTATIEKTLEKMNFKKLISGFLGLIGLAIIAFAFYWDLIRYHDPSQLWIVTALGFGVISIAILVYLVYTLRDDSRRRDEELLSRIDALKGTVEYLESKILDDIKDEQEPEEGTEQAWRLRRTGNKWMGGNRWENKLKEK